MRPCIDIYITPLLDIVKLLLISPFSMVFSTNFRQTKPTKVLGIPNPTVRGHVCDGFSTCRQVHPGGFNGGYHGYIMGDSTNQLL